MKRNDSVKRLPRKAKKQQKKLQEKRIMSQLPRQTMMARVGGKTKDGDATPATGDNSPDKKPPIA